MNFLRFEYGAFFIMNDSRFEYETRSTAIGGFVPEKNKFDAPESAPQIAAHSFGHQLPDELTLGSYQELSVVLDPDQRTFWCSMRSAGVPSFSQTMLRELKDVYPDSLKIQNTACHEAGLGFFGMHDSRPVFIVC